MTVPRWSIRVDDFGPIKKAEVKLAPLVLLVGKNNTGKSYLASLIWTLLNPLTALYPRRPTSGRVKYQACIQIIQALRKGEKSRIERDDWRTIADWINETLSDDATEIMRRVFACENCHYRKASFTPADWPHALNVEFALRPQPSGRSAAARRPRGTRIRLSDRLLHIDIDDTEIFSEDQAFTVLRHLVRLLLLGRGRGTATYIPAARTGLVLAFKALVAGLLRDLGQDEEDSTRTTLPLPVADFLENLSYRVEFPDPEGAHFEIAEYIERHVLKGEVAAVENEDFGLVPAGGKSSLPMHAVSSLVTELTPLVILLKSGVEQESIIFEEPEAHLHLAAQRMLARSLARLVNSGVQVILTTHSDTFLQQMNILMQLHDHPEREALAKEFGYLPDEVIDPAQANGYLFEDGESGTLVRPMTKTRSGFVEPVMNETIAQLSKEVLRLEEMDPGADHG